MDLTDKTYSTATDPHISDIEICNMSFLFKKKRILFKWSWLINPQFYGNHLCIFIKALYNQPNLTLIIYW